MHKEGCYGETKDKERELLSDFSLGGGRKSTASQKELFRDLFPWLCLIGTYFAAVLFHLIYGKELLNSDMSAEILLADQLNRNGEFLISRNWYYSTELWVVNRHLTLQLGLLLFPHNWHFARTFSQAVMLAFHAASYLFLMHECEMKRAGVYSAALLMCPFGFWYMWYGTYNCSYLLFMIYISLTLAIILHITKKKGPDVWWILLLIFLSFVEGLNGIRMLMNLFIPLLLTATLVIFLRMPKMIEEKSILKAQEIRFAATTFLSVAACGVGYLVNGQILSQYYTYQNYSDEFWGSLQLSSLINIWSMFLGLFGYPYAENWSFVGWTENALFSGSGILGAFGIVTVCAVVFCTVRLLFRWKELDFSHLVVILMFWTSFAVASVVYSWIYEKPNASYWLPVVPLVVAVVSVEIKTAHFELAAQQKILALALAFCVLCCSVSTVSRFLEVRPRTMPGLDEVGEWLSENGWTKGYATFWNSDLLTELTNGEVDVWTVTDVYTLESSQWLQSKTHDEMPEGKVFMLLNPYEDETLVELPYRQEEYVIYSDDCGYVVLGFDSAEQLYGFLGASE